MSVAPSVRSVRTAAALGTLALLTACATPQNRDPMEAFNRKVFGFNEAVDTAVVAPVARGYVAVTPQPVQTGVTNFLNNLKDVWATVNLFLQGRVGEGAQNILRVAINSTLGVAGLVDVATELQLDRKDEDFGQTLGTWGVPSGAYVVLPFLGPSTVRDTAALPLDLYAGPTQAFSEVRDINVVRGLNIIDVRARLLGASDLLGDVALDKYTFIRDAFLQRRRSQVYNGDVPEEAYDDEPQAWWQPTLPAEGVSWSLPTGSTLNTARPTLGWLPTHQTASLVAVPVNEQAPQMSGPTPEEMAGLRESLDVR
ncbi:VacJ family lipoprotein [Aquabacterium lacunae]|uniref:VacJ family lipoprotein n=1 Tax=Aquabacterium lacunae TaxID=2528630 RepID=A0A4Q9H421_9BURK|nr:VacJ family lipoprotein [Aquabacterium lacunae]TBO30131.1 VacJ family lipoprotein [Aquabacterium lacunae]